MHWKEQLKKLEHEEAFDIAIFFMQQVIEHNQDDKDAYLSLIYLLADTIIEPHSWDFDLYADEAKREYYKAKYNEYSTLAKKYFAQFYFKFMHDPEYLFVVGYAFLACPWIVGLDDNYSKLTTKKAHELDPSNPIYLCDYYDEIYRQDPTNPELIAWANLMQSSDSPLQAWIGRGRVWDYAARMVRYVPYELFKEMDGG